MRSELVTALKRKATEILSQLKKDKASILITQRGRPAAYLVDVKTYEELQRRLAVLQASPVVNAPLRRVGPSRRWMLRGECPDG